MNKIVRHTLAVLSLVVIAVVITVVYNGSEKNKHTKTCTGLRVELADERNFLSKNDIKSFLDNGYGAYVGQRLEDIDLKKVEKILDNRSAVLKSEAFVTSDGLLNVRITQREPVVRFQKGNFGFYADERGYIFPLQHNYSSLVPIVDGEIPIEVEKGYKGVPKDARQKKWLGEIINMISYMAGSGIWEENISQITVSRGGDLVLIPRVGKERFVFGSPTEIEEKFSRIREYYESVVAEKGKDYYSSVNVKFDGQIVCRQ